jgi:hypothetical protein
MTKNYILVNPYIEGNMKKIFQAENSLVAADKAYQQISGYFNNSIKKFHFTLLKLKSDSFDENSFNLHDYAKSNQKYLNAKYFSNFEASEHLSGEEVKYTISSLSDKINQNAVKHLVSNINKIQKKSKKSKKSKNSKKSKKSKLSSRSSSDSDSKTGSDSVTSHSSPSQNGGKRSKYDDDDDDDDSPDNYYKVINPISYYYYYPYFYDTYVYNPDPFFYVPTFVSPLSFPLVIDFKPTSTTASSSGVTTVKIST